MQDQIAARIKKAGLNMDFVIKNSLEVTKSYASSANADPEKITYVYKQMLLTMVEVFDGIPSDNK